MFTPDRAGTYRTNLSHDAQYRSFIPSKLPPDPPIVIDDDMVRLLVEANRRMATLNSISSSIPDINQFISMYVRKEALMSSQIEGTQATLEDVLDPTIDRNANRDVADVINYIRATTFAIDRLHSLPLCNRLIRETHSILLDNVRGLEKSPGEFRNSQNWIGGSNSTIRNARYIPPSVEDMNQALTDLEKYINYDDQLDHLVRIALIHYQFETIHPFLDGNGRIGRLHITLYLLEKKVLNTPAIYISYTLKKNRVEYYDRMTEVRNSGNYEQWIKFFLLSFIESAEDAIDTIMKLSDLHRRNIEIISKMGRARFNAERLFIYLESNPIINISLTAKDLSLTYNAVSGAVKRLIDAGIVTEFDSADYNKTYVYKEYLDILRDGTEPL